MLRVFIDMTCYMLLSTLLDPLPRCKAKLINYILMCLVGTPTSRYQPSYFVSKNGIFTFLYPKTPFILTQNQPSWDSNSKVSTCWYFQYLTSIGEKLCNKMEGITEDSAAKNMHKTCTGSVCQQANNWASVINRRSTASQRRVRMSLYVDSYM